MPSTVAVRRIPSLDGLRALSIAMVVGLHSLQALSLHEHVRTFWFLIFNGQSGVYVFFEISGFLITTLLLQEHERRGSISLRSFYVRRVFRILPPLYLYIGVVVLLGLKGLLTVQWSDVMSSVLFFHNFSGHGTWPLEHLWSISVEEQFYGVWPFVLVCCLRKKGLSGRYAGSVFPIAILLLSPIVRMLLSLSSNAALHKASIHDFNFDFIMYGCLVALLQHTRRFEMVYRAATRIWWLPIALMLACNMLSAYFKNKFDLTIGFTLNGFAIATFLLWCTRNGESLLGRILNSGLLVRIGVLSYSIYLWQTVFLHEGNEMVFERVPWLGRIPGSYVGILLAACGSYYLIEQPALRLKDVILRRLHLYRNRRAQLGVAAS